MLAIRSTPLLLATLVACGGPDPSPVPQPTEQRKGAAPASIAGNWRVIGSDSKGIERNPHLRLEITGERISLEPTCLGTVWTYAYADGALQTSRAQLYPPLPPGTPPRPVCAVMPAPGNTGLARIVDAAERVEQLPDGTVHISGGSGGVALRRE